MSQINIPEHMTPEPDIYAAFNLIIKDTAVLFGSDIFFLWGPRTEIIDSLISMSKSPDASKKKYPLIALVGNSPINDNVVTCSFIVATLSDVNSKADVRKTRSYTSKLQPIVKHFRKAIVDSNLFDVQHESELQSSDYVLNFDYAKGRLQDNDSVSTDVIDAIELKNIKLKLKK